MLNRTRIRGLLKKENIRGLAVLVIVIAIPTLAILGFAGVFDSKDDAPTAVPTTPDPGPFLPLPNEPEPYYANCTAAERDKARASRFTIRSPISGDRGLPTRLLGTRDGDGDGVICELIWKR